MTQTRHLLRVAGTTLILCGWLLMTAAQAVPASNLPDWLSTGVVIAGGGLVIWGSLRTKVARLEIDMEKKVAGDVFEQLKDQLEERHAANVERLEEIRHDVRELRNRSRGI